MLRRISDALYYSLSNPVVIVLSHENMIVLREEAKAFLICDYKGRDSINGVPILEAKVQRSYVVYESYDGPIVQML